MATRTIDPQAKVDTTADHVLRLAYSLPVAILKNLYPTLGKEKILKLVQDTVLEETPIDRSL
jgi:hypothetical protein